MKNPDHSKGMGEQMWRTVNVREGGADRWDLPGHPSCVPGYRSEPTLMNYGPRSTLVCYVICAS